MLGEAYAHDNQPDKAIAAFEQALRVNPNSEDANRTLKNSGDIPLRKRNGRLLKSHPTNTDTELQISN